jgi:hypothetical protein
MRPWRRGWPVLSCLLDASAPRRYDCARPRGGARTAAIDTALNVGKKVLEGSPKGASGHHDPAGKPPTKPQFHLTRKLTTAEKDAFRAEAREIAETARGKRLPYGSDVHHRNRWNSLTCSHTWIRTGSRT